MLDTHLDNVLRLLRRLGGYSTPEDQATLRLAQVALDEHRAGRATEGLSCSTGQSEAAGEQSAKRARVEAFKAAYRDEPDMVRARFVGGSRDGTHDFVRCTVHTYWTAVFGGMDQPVARDEYERSGKDGDGTRIFAWVRRELPAGNGHNTGGSDE